MDESFYTQCAELLGVQHEGEPFAYRKRTRWNNRIPGRGRYPGRGIIRKFGNKIHVALNSPISHHGIYDSEEEVLIFLKNLNISS